MPLVSIDPHDQKAIDAIDALLAGAAGIEEEKSCKVQK
jgi:hypothetical protein